MRRGAPLRRPVVAAPSGSGRVQASNQEAALRAWTRLLAVHKRALGMLRGDLEPDMTVARFDLLATLARDDGQTLASLARAMERPNVNLRGLVARAARDGLVERRAAAPSSGRSADAAPRRARRVYITPKGRRALTDTERRHARRIGALFAALSRAELGVLAQLLDKMKHAWPEPAARMSGVSGEGTRETRAFAGARARAPAASRRRSRRPS